MEELLSSREAVEESIDRGKEENGKFAAEKETGIYRNKKSNTTLVANVSESIRHDESAAILFSHYIQAPSSIIISITRLAESYRIKNRNFNLFSS